MTVDGFLETCSTVEQVYDVMQRLKFHYYFIDIENSKTATHLITKNQHYHQTDTHFEQYKKFIYVILKLKTKIKKLNIV